MTSQAQARSGAERQAHAIGLSVILPAHDEAAYIGPCLEALLASDPPGCMSEVIVVANGCRDDTAVRVRALADRAAAAGWRLQVIETPQGGKPHALNLGDAAASGGVRLYLDADVIVSPGLVRALAERLNTPAPRYASGRPEICPPVSAVTRAYARVWTRLPFLAAGVPGFGLFAMNAAGRARWGDWPAIISDDTFARLNFAPQERHMVPQTYCWPLVEGFARLVRVRRRQNTGVREIALRYPHLMANDDKMPVGAGGALRLLASDPVGMAVYGAVALAVKLPPLGRGTAWARGR